MCEELENVHLIYSIDKALYITPDYVSFVKAVFLNLLLYVIMHVLKNRQPFLLLQFLNMCLFIWKAELLREGESETEVLYPWQVKPGASSGCPTWAIFHYFPATLVGSWIEHGQRGLRLVPLRDARAMGSGF